ncbi:MAG: hypothetical protein ACRCX1_04245 [Bacteroidales bacterium]
MTELSKEYPKASKESMCSIFSFTSTGTNQNYLVVIAYVEIKEDVYYPSLVMEAYSRKIAGWTLGYTFEHIARALLMFIESAGERSLSVLIHHSDRGVQYCCHNYFNIHDEYDIKNKYEYNVEILLKILRYKELMIY